MKFKEALYLVAKYGICFNCGNEYLGKQEGHLIITEEKFSRSCKCGIETVIYFKQKENENEL